ncbi:uncharacterized protein LOC127259552 isoform X2 [Andrographis paniculata]|uniref:uncharacterized protein LOC127259552 isoform X2 n=1 Tax=Andrographis paniculata TaxID=175694 RepID=UPI0021E92365|nr:uncharacterized protein LOC127259552 isoform X2 [Andrographis paniculata]
MAGSGRRKLLINERVEVKSQEDGFLGSWHSAKVIGWENFLRLVRYDYILDDEEYCNLTEEVKVSAAVEGSVTTELVEPGECKGLIRPLPPPNVRELPQPHLRYGQCVDMYHNDAWWEGVVFDHDDKCDRRKIFFPELGDVWDATMDLLRISADWDEVTGEWKPRGNWLLIEVVEELTVKLPLPKLTSLQQIWFDVRLKDDFEKLGDWWTSSGRQIWEELVLQVLLDSFQITAKQFLKSNHLGSSSKPLYLKFSKKALYEILQNRGIFYNSSLALVSSEETAPFYSEGNSAPNLNDEGHFQVQERNDQACPAMVASEQAPSPSGPALPNLTNSPGEGAIIGSEHGVQSPNRSSKLPPKKYEYSTNNRQWLSIVSRSYSAECCPDAYNECKEVMKLNKRPSDDVMSNTKKHLLYLGWKVEVLNDKGRLRYRYFSPENELFYSLRQVCLKFDSQGQASGPGSQKKSRKDKIGSVTSPEAELPPSLPENQECSRELSKSCNSLGEQILIEPEYCPEAVYDYDLYSKDNKHPGSEAKLKLLKAKKHLASVGWTFSFKVKGERRELRYREPNGRTFSSLAQACSWCVKNWSSTSREPSPSVGRIGSANAETDNAMRASESPLPLPTVGSGTSVEEPNVDASASDRILRKKGKDGKSHHIERSLPPRRRRKPRALLDAAEDALMETTEDIQASCSTSAQRSSKRVRIAATPEKAPQTVLSWLIDNHAVQPKAKVRYHRKLNDVPLKEGRILREGIMCSCCNRIYSISEFGAHAGSKAQRPAANIFFEDGKSLLEHQRQLSQKRKNQQLRSESFEREGSQHQENDSICSICHEGGDLLLCDQCPSSYHFSCIGLKGVPDGDWFCPSCCCQVCGLCRLERKVVRIPAPALICTQCEHRYHADCLENNEVVNAHGRPEGQWFCRDSCKQIFDDLQKILGRPIPVGGENLTWTLLKDMKSDDGRSVEYSSKLNVALSVMHECFEPVKIPGTRRDLVEDVIFGRWSNLPRLNFKGFYTVLLEKNDEVISIASVRIFGEKVAEVPLVATRFHFRRLGMCRILMNELEKNLMELGVQRLVLPAVAGVLNTWTTSFGFSVMNQAERQKLRDHIFLHFQDTITCQKMLGGLSTPCTSTGTDNAGRGQSESHPVMELVGNCTEIGLSERKSKRGAKRGAGVVDNEDRKCSNEAGSVGSDGQSQPNKNVGLTKTIPVQAVVSPNYPKGSSSHDVPTRASSESVLCYKRRKHSTRSC